MKLVFKSWEMVRQIAANRGKVLEGGRKTWLDLERNLVGGEKRKVDGVGKVWLPRQLQYERLVKSLTYNYFQSPSQVGLTLDLPYGHLIDLRNRSYEVFPLVGQEHHLLHCSYLCLDIQIQSGTYSFSADLDIGPSYPI